MTPPPLEALSVSVRLGGERDAIHELTLALHAGEVLGLLGRNGAGKSTLGRVLAGLLQPTRGEVRLHGRPLGALPRREVARALAWLAQEPAGDVGFTALEFVLLGRAPWLGPLGLDSEADRERARAALARLHVGELEARPFAQLSGGERRRVELARLLVQEAPLWILDEPAAHLDVAHVQLALSLARERADAGGAVVVVLHELAAAASCDRLALLQEGRLVATGTPAELLTPEALEPVLGVRFVRVTHPETGAPVLLPAALRAPRESGSAP